MYSAIGIDEKVFMWEGYKELAEKLANTVEDDYNFKLARYGREADKDAEQSKKLYETMYNVLDSIKGVLEVLNKEWDDEQEQTCKNLKEQYAKAEATGCNPNVFNDWVMFEDTEEVLKYLKEQNQISKDYEVTFKAVNAFYEQQR